MLRIFKKLRSVIGNLILGFSRVELFFKRPLPTSDPYAAELRKSGFIRLNDRTGLSEEILHLFSTRLEKPEHLFRDINIEELVKDKIFVVDLSNEILWKYVFTEDLYRVLAAYFGGEFYLRNNVCLIMNKEGGAAVGSDNKHIDGAAHACNVMINLVDIGQEQTCMRYFLGSNNWNYFGIFPNMSKIKNSLIEKYKDAKFANTHGPRDSCFIFDAGNGLHQKQIGKDRTFLLINFVNNKSQKYLSDSRGPNIDKDAFYYSLDTPELQELIKKSPFNNGAFDCVVKNLPMNP